MPLVRGEYAEQLAPGVNYRTFQAYREKPEIYRLINNVKTSNSAWEDDYAMAGFGPLAPKTELGPTILDEPLKLGGTRIFMYGYALAFVMSEELREDGKYNLFGDLAAALGRSARYTAELFGHDVWNHAFDTDKYVGRDGEALISLAHPVAGTGGTLANRPATDTDLTQEALEAAWLSYQTQLDDRGILIDMQPAILLVHPMNVMLARRLLESSSSLAANENAGVINPIQGMLRIVASPYLVDPGAWFILPEPSQLDVLFYWRKTPDTKTWDDDDADGTIHKIKQRHGQGFRDWRGVYGSPGE
jgi:hypothetical protein